MREISISIIAVAVWAACGCSPTDSERCGQGMYYSDGDCFYCDDSDTGSGADTSTETVTDIDEGLGVECEDQSDCAGYAADYCVLNPFDSDPGICTYQDCNTDPDDCPPPWFCCVLPESADMPDICLNTELSEEVAEWCL